MIKKYHTALVEAIKYDGTNEDEVKAFLIDRMIRNNGKSVLSFNYDVRYQHVSGTASSTYIVDGCWIVWDDNRFLILDDCDFNSIYKEYK